MSALEVLETCLYANDLETAEPFYRDVLGLEVVDRQVGRHVFFRCGRSMLLLFDPDASIIPNTDVPPHGARGPGHVAFSIAQERLGEWEQRLGEHGVAIERRITWPSGGQSLYFRDPANNSVELTQAGIWGLTTASA